MTNISGPAAALWALAAGTTLTLATPAFSQAPTDAQRSAIRSACRSDYIAHCSSVPPGGMASLQCLQKNMSSLSSGCKTAVNAVEAPAEPKAEAKPESKPDAAPAASSAAPAEKPAAEAAPAPAPKATPKMAPKTAAAPAAGTTAKKPSSTQVAAIRSACRSDYMAHCSSVPTGGAAALKCLQKNLPKLSGSCQQAVNAAGGGAGAPAAAGNAPAAANTASPAAVPAAAPAPLILRAMRPREVLFVLRSACGGDVRALCGGVPAGGGRIVACLAERAAALSPSCRDVLSSFAQ